MSARRKRGERGASLVEFALILPLLVLLICGLIDFGVTFNDYQSLRSGVRNGTRDAVVTNFGSNTSCGSSTAGTAGKIVCHVKDLADLGDDIRVGVWAPGGWQVGTTLRVCAQAEAESLTGVTAPFLNNRILNAKVEMRIEQALPASAAFTAAQDAPFTTWPSECTS